MYHKTAKKSIVFHKKIIFLCTLSVEQQNVPRGTFRIMSLFILVASKRRKIALRRDFCNEA